MIMSLLDIVLSAYINSIGPEVWHLKDELFDFCNSTIAMWYSFIFYISSMTNEMCKTVNKMDLRNELICWLNWISIGNFPYSQYVFVLAIIWYTFTKHVIHSMGCTAQSMVYISFWVVQPCHRFPIYLSMLYCFKRQCQLML